MSSSPNDSRAKVVNPKVRKLLARAYLRANRIHEALEVYCSIHQDFPEDTEVLLTLGNLYRLAGCEKTAAQLDNMVLAVNPGHGYAVGQAAELCPENSDCAQETDALSPEAIERLAAKLQGETLTAQQEKIHAAAEMLGTLDADGRAPELNEQHLLPALIEMNIRQARVEGSTEIAEALQSLQINLSHQVDDLWADDLLKEDLPFGP
jgi:tetratricopeptide (TPR) repeat protein